MIHGYVIVDKPQGLTSTQVVTKIKHLFHAKKAGHGGTLDPLATGLLPIALGEATKTLPFVLDGKKAYRFEVKWGEARTTEDCEGDVTASSDKRPTKAEIEKALPLFTGSIQQIPPIYSAIKVKGKRAYALARQGEEVILAPREVHIEKFTLLTSSLTSATFEVVCSKGTYIRSLARDVAIKLGTYGYLTQLRRLVAGPFQEKDAILLDSLLQIGHNTELVKYILPLQDALADILALEIQDIDAEKLQRGQRIPSSYKGEEKIALVSCKGIPQALTEVREGWIKPFRVFNIG